MYILSRINRSNTIISYKIFYNYYSWPSIISHQNTHEIDYLNPCNNCIFRHDEIDFSANPHFLKKKKNSVVVHDLFPIITDGIHDATSESHMINREPRCLLRLRLSSGQSVFLFLFRSTRVGNRECTGITLHANGIWAQRLCSRMHACTDAGRPWNIIAVMRWNWGSLALTRVLGTSTCVVCSPCENLRARRIVRVISSWAFLEVSVSTLNDKWKYAVPHTPS